VSDEGRYINKSIYRILLSWTNSLTNQVTTPEGEIAQYNITEPLYNLVFKLDCFSEYTIKGEKDKWKD
jgi:hypothetical protein